MKIPDALITAVAEAALGLPRDALASVLIMALPRVPVRTKTPTSATSMRKLKIKRPGQASETHRYRKD